MTDDRLDALDLRPILALQPEARALMARVTAGDVTAIAPAEALLTAEREMVEAVKAAVTAFAEDSMLLDDAVWVVVNALGTGDLGAELDELRHDLLEQRYGPVPDDGIGLRGHHGWVHFVEQLDASTVLIRFPDSGDETIVSIDQISAPRCDVDQ